MPRARAHVLTAALGTLLLLGRAQAEVFIFKDQTEVRGKILVEFDEVLFVRLDGGAPGFLARSALAAIATDDGKQRLVDPPPGTFAPYRKVTPAGVVTDVVGEAWLSAGAGAPASIDQAPLFLDAAQRVSTGEASFVRLLLPSGTVCRLSPESEAALADGASEGLSLLRGEAHLTTELKPLELMLPAPLSARVEPHSQLEVRHEGPLVRLRQHGGRALLRSEGSSLELGDGLGVELRQNGASWQVMADPANPAAIQLQRQKKTYQLQPGESQGFGAGAATTSTTGEAWRLLVSSGSLRVRRGLEAGFTRHGGGSREPLVLTTGDAVRTSGGGSATFVRGDGATLTLGEQSHLELASALSLSGGRLTVEALDTPVRLQTPGGIATLSLVVLEVVRQEAAAGLGVRAAAGVGELPLGPTAALLLEKNAQALVTAGPPGGAHVQLSTGAAKIVSRGSPEQDPRYQVSLQTGDALAVRAEPSQAPALLLPGKRVLSFASGGVDAQLTLQPEPTCRFKGGAEITMKQGLELALASDGEHPELHFKDGTQLSVQHGFKFLVENPTIVLQLDGGETIRIKLANLHARLMKGGRHSVASLGVRDEDLLEVSGRGDVSLDRSRDLVRFSYSDQRRLWIQDGAPPVQSRFADPSGTAFLTMPGVAALGTQPNRRMTVLATRDGEFIILDQDDLDLGDTDLEGLSGGQRGPVPTLTSDPVPDLLDVPRADSPSGP